MRLGLLADVTGLHLLLDVRLEGCDLIVHAGHEVLVRRLFLLVEVDILLDSGPDLVMLFGECHAVLLTLG